MMKAMDRAWIRQTCPATTHPHLPGKSQWKVFAMQRAQFNQISPSLWMYLYGHLLVYPHTSVSVGRFSEQATNQSDRRALKLHLN